MVPSIGRYYILDIQFKILDINTITLTLKAESPQNKEQMLCSVCYVLEVYTLFIHIIWSYHCSSVVMKPTSIHEDVGLTPGLTYWVKDLALL